MLKASHVMTRRVETLSPDMTAGEAAQLLSERRISGAPVIDASGRLVGVLSQKDVLGRSGHKRVRELMTREILAVEEDTGLVEIARLMSDRRVHRVVVVRGHRLAGLVSSLDILRALADAFDISERRAARGGRRPLRGRAAAGRRP